MTQDVQTIKKDRLRYTKDSFSSTMAILAIVFDCLFFVSIYQSDVGNFYYTWLIGVSIIYNLVFLLAAFLASESVKNRKSGYSGILVVLGVLQIVRIFILPAKAHGAVVVINGVEKIVMENGQYLYCVACLAISAVCCIVAALVSARNNKILADYMKTIETKAA